MCRYVTEPWDGSHDRLHWHQANEPTVIPSLLRMMTRSQLRILATLRRVWRLIDWQTVGEIAWEGLKLTIALTIVCGMYTAEGVQKSYNWLQPRLANLLQHPQQTITKGPAFLYAECVEATLFSDNATIGQKIIVTVVAEYQHFTDNVWDFVEEIKYNFSEFVKTIQETVTVFYIQGQRMI